MQITRSAERSPGNHAIEGLAGWLIRLIQKARNGSEPRQEQMRLIERLQLGGKRELLLVCCAGTNYLVGGGADSVQTIVRVESNVTLASVANLNEGCVR